MNTCCDHSFKLDEIIKIFNIKKTKSKIDILKIFIKAKKPLSIKDIYENLTQYNESTIFRNINQFKDIGIIDEIDLLEGYKRFELKPKNHHHHYAKCNKCLNIIQLNNCDISIFNKQLKKIGFQIETHQIEIFGLCKKCL